MPLCGCRKRAKQPVVSIPSVIESIGNGLPPSEAHDTYKRLLQVLDAALDQGDGYKLESPIGSSLDSVRLLKACGFNEDKHDGNLVLPAGADLRTLREARELIDVLVISYAEEAHEAAREFHPSGETGHMQADVRTSNAATDQNHGEGPVDAGESHSSPNRMAPQSPEAGSSAPDAVMPMSPDGAGGTGCGPGSSASASTSAGNGGNEEGSGSDAFGSPDTSMEDRDRAFAERLAREEQPKVVEFQRFRSENVLVDASMVEEINSACRASGERYVDPQFPPLQKSLYLEDWESDHWQCHSCLTRNKMPPVPPLPKSREEAKQQEEEFKANTLCQGCGEHAPYVVQVRCFTRPTQWLRPGDRCEGCELVYGHLPGGRDLVPQMCTHFIRDSISHTTVGAPWKLIREAARPEDVCQGGLGNCWFAGALSVVAQMPQLIDRLFFTKEFNPCGVYHLQLFHAGEWRGMVLDDLLPTSQIFEGYLDGQMMYYSRGGSLTFLQGARRQLWVPLVEKAASKLFGSYGSLKGGTFGEALAMFTGFPTQRIRLYVPKAVREARAKRRAAREAQRLMRPHMVAMEDSDSDENDDLTWSKLLSCKDAGYLMGMGCTEEGCEKTKKHIVEEKGLQAPHAYGILDVREAQVNDEVVRLLKIRNPWGERAPRTWKGDWGKDSDKWTPELQRELAIINSSGVQMDDPMSIFWMAFKDAKEYFAQVEICRVHAGWHETRQRAWLPSAVGPGEAFDLTVFRRTQVDLVAWQEKHLVREGALGARSTNVDVGLAVLRAYKGKGTDGQVEFELIEYLARDSSDDVSREFVLEGGYVYRVVPLCYGQILEAAPRCASIAVHSVHPVELTKVRNSWRDIACATFEGGKKRGNRWADRTHPGVTYWLLHEPAGCTFVVENTSNTATAVQVDASDSVGCIYSRGAPGCVALIPPRTWQVALVLAYSAHATHTRVSLVPQPVPKEMAEAGEGVHRAFPTPAPGSDARTRPSPSEAILRRAPPEQPAEPQSNSSPQQGRPLGSQASPAAMPPGGPSMRFGGEPVAAEVVALDEGEELDEDLVAALRLSLECAGSAPSTSSAPAASTLAGHRGAGYADVQPEVFQSGGSAAFPSPALREEQRVRLQARAKELFASFRTAGMSPNEAAARAGEEARRELGIAPS